MDAISSVINNQKNPIGNSAIGLNKNIKTNSPIGLSNRVLNSTIVDKLLQDYSDLIDTAYIPWFAKRFYTMPFDLIHRCASEARQEAKNDPRRLFAHLVKKHTS